MTCTQPTYLGFFLTVRPDLRGLSDTYLMIGDGFLSCADFLLDHALIFQRSAVGLGLWDPAKLNPRLDYLASHVTTDLAYSVILEHTLAEKERRYNFLFLAADTTFICNSPAVVGRCVALLKRHLLRYKPSEETLQQIDRFCVSIISECSVNLSRRSSSWSQPSSQQSGASTTTTNISPLPVSGFASLGALVKSLDYVRSLVAQHMPKRSFQAAAFSGAPSASRQALPTLSSLLSKSFNSQLSPANNKDSLENKEASALSVSNSPIVEEVDGIDDREFIALDVLKWRWCGDKHLSLLSTESDHVPSPQDASTHSFLELGAAALLVGDMEAKMKGQPWRIFGTTDMPYLDQLLQPSLLTTVTSSASAGAHLTAITASKRTKSGPHQIWHLLPINLHANEELPNISEHCPIHLVADDALSRTSPRRCGTPKYLDANVLSSWSCLGFYKCKKEKMSCGYRGAKRYWREDSPLSTFRPRARPLFQYRYYSEQQPLRLNPAEVCEVIAAVCSETPSSNANIMTISSKLSNNSGKPSMDVAVSVLIKLVIDMYVLDSGSAAPLTLSMLEEMLNSPRLASRSRAFDLILNLGVHALFATQSKRKPDYSKQMDNSSATNNFETWILGILYEILLHLVHIQEKDESVWASALSCLLYFVCDRGKIRRNRLEGLDIRVVKALIEISRRNSWAEIVDLIGGIEFIFLELVLSNSREERRNLYLVLFDYVLHLINETCIAAGVSEYSDDEIQPIATLLMLADAPEAFYISVKLGVEGIGELLRRSISAALSSYPNSDRLNTLLEKITEKLDTFTSSFSHLDKEFGQIVQITKSYKSMENIKDGILGHTVGMKVKLSWSTLHSLIHSERLVCRQNGWGFLFLLERLLMRCKFLLDENELQNSGSIEAVGQVQDNSRLEKANAVIDIMSSALSLVAQINETDRINILKMCDILFSQLCLKVLPSTAMPFRDTMHDGKVFRSTDRNKKADAGEHFPREENVWLESMEDMKSRFGHHNDTLFCETASMAALLLRGQAIVPMQLVARVPAALFYWPLIQLAGAATDNIALGVSVGSKGRGNLPGATSDIRATLLLLLIGKCTADPAAFQEVGGEEFFRELLDDTDSRVAYYSSTFLLKRMMTEEPEKYQRMLQNLVFRAQQILGSRLKTRLVPEN
ncbi:hypothetical protein Acr_02g0004350 [Actinidia rufa]|uniref:ARM repeat superfamily protein n=1 Tax=Actinidia rufa TaxID=165716 RepID=A0A7J0E756_9ERIC|nr:hypothetical protein Acr_02g0004350 [Actinidia rufa]